VAEEKPLPRWKHFQLTTSNHTEVDVLTHNLHRRHLSTTQKAQVAVELEKLLQPDAKERIKQGAKNSRSKAVEKMPQPKQEAKSRDQAAAMVGVSGRTVDAAEHHTPHG
jgi:hypothetical protein